VVNDSSSSAPPKGSGWFNNRHLLENSGDVQPVALKAAHYAPQ